MIVTHIILTNNLTVGAKAFQAAFVVVHKPCRTYMGVWVVFKWLPLSWTVNCHMWLQLVGLAMVLAASCDTITKLKTCSLSWLFGFENCFGCHFVIPHDPSP